MRVSLPIPCGSGEASDGRHQSPVKKILSSHPYENVREVGRILVGENPNGDRICAWCNPNVRGSHGICFEHAKEVLAQVGLEVVREGEFQVVREVAHR